jgi:hypothetical protein
MTSFRLQPSETMRILISRIKYFGIAAKRRKRRKSAFIYALLALFRGYSLFPIRGLCYRFRGNARATDTT